MQSGQAIEEFFGEVRQAIREFSQVYLGLSIFGGLHPFGEHLARAVRRAKVIKLEPDTWYRARRDIDIGAISKEDFLPADPKKVRGRAGRFNSAGQLAYYVADSPETAAVEVLKWADRIAWLQDGDPD